MKHQLGGSVGKGGSNSANDVKLTQALLNVWLRRESKKALPVTGKPSPETLSAIETFQKDVRKLSKPDGRIDAGGHTFNALTAILDGVLRDNLPPVKPAEGVVTFDSEGNEGGPYHSRILHVPSATSGLTLGRGYDMKLKTGTKISTDLTSAGVGTEIALLMGKASGKFGASARQFVIDNDLLDFQITPLAQKKLFSVTYGDESRLAEKACNQTGYVSKYGKCDWDKLDTAIKEIVIDLKFRGDYRNDTAKYIQEFIVGNDLKGFTKAMKDPTLWPTVPKDRFERRKKFLE